MVANPQPDKPDMNRTNGNCPLPESGHGHREVYIIPPVSDPIPSVVKVVLTPEQTAEVIQQAGGDNHFGRVFVVMSPGSYPTAPGRLVLHFIECPDMATATAAIRVAMGEARAVKIKSKP
jgi:hypothetical protein